MNFKNFYDNVIRFDMKFPFKIYILKNFFDPIYVSMSKNKQKSWKYSKSLIGE